MFVNNSLKKKSYANKLVGFIVLIKIYILKVVINLLRVNEIHLFTKLKV